MIIAHPGMILETTEEWPRERSVIDIGREEGRSKGMHLRDYERPWLPRNSEVTTLGRVVGMAPDRQEMLIVVVKTPEDRFQ